MNRSLSDVLAIAKELKAVYEAYRAAAADKHVTADEGLALAAHVLDVLVTHNVTIAELRTLIGEIGPFLAMVK